MSSVSLRPTRLFIFLSGLFITNALMAEFIGVKIFALEDTLGLPPLDWRLFGQSGSLSFTAGVMLWPVVFIMTDIINEYFGVRGVRFISWLAVGFIAYAFLFAYLAIELVEALVAAGRAEAAGEMLANLPVQAMDAPRLKTIEARLFFARALEGQPDEEALRVRVEADPRDAAAACALAARQFLTGRVEPALDRWLEVLRYDRNHGDGLARRSLLAAFDLLEGQEELVGSYRRKMMALLH